MFSLLKSSVQTLLRPILTVFGMQNQPELPRDVILDLPPKTPQSVDYWCTSAIERYIERPDYRKCKVVRLRRYKKANNAQHEYLTATVEHPLLNSLYGPVLLRIERQLEHLEPNGTPVLCENQKDTPPNTPGGDISQGFWATWLASERTGELSPSRTTKSSGFSSNKIGLASDVVRLWNPPLLNSDVQIEDLDLTDKPVPLVHLAILANVVHDQESLYNLFLTQCYWYANMIARVVARENSIKKDDDAAKETDYCYDKASGKFWVIPVHWVRPQVITAIQEEYRKRRINFNEEVDVADRQAEARLDADRVRVQSAVDEARRPLEEENAALLERIRQLELGST